MSVPGPVQKGSTYGTSGGGGGDLGERAGGDGGVGGCDGVRQRGAQLVQCGSFSTHAVSSSSRQHTAAVPHGKSSTATHWCQQKISLRRHELGVGVER